MHVNVLALVSFKDDFRWPIAVHAECLVLSFAVPLNVNIHEVCACVEILEFNVSVSECVWTNFLLTVVNYLKVSIV